MYFFAFPLLLLFTSTICASPVDIKNRGHFWSKGDKDPAAMLRATVMKKKGTWAYHEFCSKGATRIPEWSSPDEMVKPFHQDYKGMTFIVKKVDLSTVETMDGLTQEEQVFQELDFLATVGFLETWSKQVVGGGKSEEPQKTFFYIGIWRHGVPASDYRMMTEEERAEARKKGMEYFERKPFKLRLDEAHNQDQYFGFNGPGRIALPHMLRYAKKIEIPSAAT